MLQTVRVIVQNLIWAKILYDMRVLNAHFQVVVEPHQKLNYLIVVFS